MQEGGYDLAARHARVRQTLDTLSLDALVVTCAPNIRYLSNHAGSSGVLVLTYADPKTPSTLFTIASPEQAAIPEPSPRNGGSAVQW